MLIDDENTDTVAYANADINIDGHTDEGADTCSYADIADTHAGSDIEASADANAAGATDAGTNIKADADTV